jgi:hypothetical protein
LRKVGKDPVQVFGMVLGEEATSGAESVTKESVDKRRLLISLGDLPHG